MKLRTTARSIRLRLSQAEVRQFAETGIVEETIEINQAAGERFGYQLIRSADNATAARFENGFLTISVAPAEANYWTSTESVGIEANHSNGTAEGLAILIEKDFVCLVPRSGEDDGDTFPNPGIAQVC
jgi:hypothetical protein